MALRLQMWRLFSSKHDTYASVMKPVWAIYLEQTPWFSGLKRKKVEHCRPHLTPPPPNPAPLNFPFPMLCLDCKAIKWGKTHFTTISPRWFWCFSLASQCHKNKWTQEISAATWATMRLVLIFRWTRAEKGEQTIQRAACSLNSLLQWIPSNAKAWARCLYRWNETPFKAFLACVWSFLYFILFLCLLFIVDAYLLVTRKSSCAQDISKK